MRHTLTGSLAQDIFISHHSAVKSSGKKSGNDRILKNNDLTYYISTIPDDKLPKGIANGHFLSGELTLFKDSKINKMVSKVLKFQLIKIRYIYKFYLKDKHKIYYHINNVSLSSKKSDKSKAKKGEKKPNECSDLASTSVTIQNSYQEDEQLNEALRDTKVGWILK